MAVNNLMSRADLGDLIPAPIQAEIIDGTAEGSASLSLMRRLPNMSSGTSKMPIIASLPSAYFVTENAAAGLASGTIKQTTEATWTYKTIYAEEIACILPIPETVLDDSNYDVWAELRPKIVEAFGVVIDAATIAGTAGVGGVPATWPNGLVIAANAAGNTVALGAGVDFVEDINSCVAMVEADGYEATGYLAPVQTKARLRGLRDTNGGLLFTPSLTAGTPDQLYGSPIRYGRNGAFGTADSHLIAGDFSQAVYSIRQDLTFKILTEATIYDANGVVQFALAQQDMVALRCVMRLGWQVPNPINRMNQVAGTRFPFAVIE